MPAGNGRAFGAFGKPVREAVYYMSLYPVILCGGSGTRLWPASRPDRPKQFLKLIGDSSSYQETLKRLREMPGAEEPVIVTGRNMLEQVLRQAAEIGVRVTVLVEPEARDSGPAIAAAAAYIQTLAPKGVMLMLAADHHIAESEIFQQAATVAAKAAGDGHIVTFGVEPTDPATGYGYIRPGAPLENGVQRVDAFVEKPDRKTAEKYLTEGYLWNSGNFAFRADVLMEEMAEFEPTIAQAARESVDWARRDGQALWLDRDAFAGAAKKSVDFAVMERTRKAAVAPAGFTWSDLGAWDAIWDASPRDEAGNSASGDVQLIRTEGVLVRSNGPFVGVIGVTDLLIVAEPDAVLVCRRDDAQSVKTLVDKLKEGGRHIAQRHVVSASGGVARQPVTKESGAEVEIWRLEDKAAAVLPAGTVQVLAGKIEGEPKRHKSGDRFDLDGPMSVRAKGGATLLVTRWL